MALSISMHRYTAERLYHGEWVTASHSDSFESLLDDVRNNKYHDFSDGWHIRRTADQKVIAQSKEQPAVEPQSEAVQEVPAPAESLQVTPEPEQKPRRTLATISAGLPTATESEIARLEATPEQAAIITEVVKNNPAVRPEVVLAWLKYAEEALAIEQAQSAPVEAIETTSTPLGHHIGIRDVGKRMDTVTYKRIVHLDSGQVWRVRVISELVKDSENTYNLHYTIANVDNGIAFVSTPRQWIIQDTSRVYNNVARKMGAALERVMADAVQDCLRLIDEVMMPPVAGNGGERPRFVTNEGVKGD